MIVIYQIPGFSQDQVTKQFVKLGADGKFRWCEINIKNKDIRQGEADINEIPESVVNNAAQYQGTAYNYVEWPIENKT